MSWGKSSWAGGDEWSMEAMFEQFMAAKGMKGGGGGGKGKDGGKAKGKGKGLMLKGGGGGKKGGGPSAEEMEWAADPIHELVQQTLEPVLHLDDSWTLEVAQKRVVTYFWKGGKTFEKDERLQTPMAVLPAQALIYDFVASIMGSVSCGCYDKKWYWEANWMPLLNYWVARQLGECKALKSVVRPLVERYVEECFTRFRDDERIGKAIETVLESSGLEGSHHTKARQFLTKTFDEAHRSAPYGLVWPGKQNEDPALKMLEDFYFGWIKDFAHRASHVLEEGIGSKEQQMVWMCGLFQALAGPQYRVIPYDAMQLFALDEAKLPGEEWQWVTEALTLVAQQINEEENAAPQHKKLRLGM